MNATPPPLLNRRRLLQTTSSGFGYLAFSALSSLSSQSAPAADVANPLAPRPPHFPARAKRIIFLAMQGGPSHVDTFDYKPQLTRDDGKEAKGFAKLLGSPFAFRRQGESGLPISELFPELSRHADDLCLLNSMHTDIPNHPQATTQMHTGNFQFVRPSLGAWTLYGLGTENSNLPGFITLSPPNGAQNYGSAFLPAVYQGTPIGRQVRSRFARGGQGAAAIPNIRNPRLSPEMQRVQLDYIKSLNEEKLLRDEYHPEVEGIIESYELAFRMQDELPDVLDIASEPRTIRDLYGADDQTTGAFARQCLSARRLAEAGVRFIQLNHGNWDHHRNLVNGLEQNCAQIDQPIAALLEDLKQRDMLKDTLVMWGGEFGRTAHGQSTNGRDHNNKGYTMWMAGGGVRGGIRYGSTDDYGAQAVENKVHIHDWHATILHLLGLNHETLTYRYAGRDFRLTDVHGEVVKGILA